MENKTLHILIDADMFCYNACAACEKEVEWPNGLNSIYSQIGEVAQLFDQTIQYTVNQVLLKTKHVGPYEIIMGFSDKELFRKKIYPLYKANRIGKRKPLCYWTLVDWVKESYTCITFPYLEADDVLGILATSPGDDHYSVIVSQDKDFLSIPGLFFNYAKRELHEVSVEDANRWHMYQTLIGDTADNYPGCPGIGPKTAEKLLTTKGYTWETVKGAFLKAKKTEEDAKLMATVARILRWGDYDAKKVEIKPFVFPDES